MPPGRGVRWRPPADAASSAAGDTASARRRSPGAACIGGRGRGLSAASTPGRPELLPRGTCPGNCPSGGLGPPENSHQSLCSPSSTSWGSAQHACDHRAGAARSTLINRPILAPCRSDRRGRHHTSRRPDHRPPSMGRVHHTNRPASPRLSVNEQTWVWGLSPQPHTSLIGPSRLARPRGARPQLSVMVRQKP